MHPAVQLSETRRRPTRGDVLLVGVLLVWSLLEAAFANPGGPVWVRLLAGAGYVLPLLFRRRWPLAALLAIAVVAGLRAWSTDVADTGAMPFPAMLVGTFSVGLYEALPLSLLGPLIPVATVVVLSQSPMWSGERLVQDYAILFFFVTAAWLGGYVIRRRAAQVRAAEASVDVRAREAVASERVRIARELHDIVAHSVSIIALQAGAAEALAEKDPATARTHMTAVRRMAHDALGEMRRLLDVLREDDAVYEPTPDLRDVEELVAASREAGVPVAVERVGSLDELPAGVSLVVYRIVQEALTNVRKHAGTVPARVVIRRERDHVEVIVENDSGDVIASSNGGYGLVGMRERVRVYGGTLAAAPVDAGGFRVAATIPLAEAEA